MDIFKPDFDRMSRHVFGGRSISYQRHDLYAIAIGAEHLPPQNYYDPHSVIPMARQLDEVRLCPINEFDYGDRFFLRYMGRGKTLSQSRKSLMLLVRSGNIMLIHSRENVTLDP